VRRTHQNGSGHSVRNIGSRTIVTGPGFRYWLMDLAGTVALLRALALAFAPLAACWQLVAHPLMTPSGMLGFAAVVLAGLALAFLAHGARIAAAGTAHPLTGRASALREKARGAVFQRQLDPDAAGRSRPRAPSAVPAAA
jgi:hypothetical protein